MGLSLGIGFGTSRHAQSAGVAAIGGLATPTVVAISAAGAVPLVLSLTDGDYVAGKYVQWQIGTGLAPAKNGDGTFVAPAQSGVAFIDGDSWARLDLALGYNDPPGAFDFICRVLQDNPSGAVTVTDQLGNTFNCDASNWSADYTDTIVTTTTTLDPANRNTNNAQLSNGNLTVTGVNQGAPQCVRTTNQVPNPGKYYFEVTITSLAASGHVTLGASDGSFVFATTFDTPGHIAGSKGAGLHDNDSIYPSVTNDGYAQATGGILQCCIKRTGTNTIRLWIGHDNVWIGDPSAETGGETVTLSAASCYGYVGVDRADVATANFGATAFTYAKPTGATAWS